MSLEPEWQAGSAAVSMVASLDGGFLLTGDRDGRLSCFVRDRWAWSTPLGVDNPDIAKLYRVRSAAWVPGADLVVCVSGPTVWGVGLTTGEVLWQRRSAYYWGFFPSRPVAVASGEDGELWASYDDGRMESLSLTGDLVSRWHESEAPVQFGRRGVPGARVACTGYGVGAWDMQERKLAWHRRLPFRAQAFATSAQSEWTAVATFGTAVLSRADGSESKKLELGPGLPALALSRDGSKLASATDSGLQWIDAAAGSRVAHSVNAGRVTAVEFDAEGTLWYGTSVGGLGRVWAGVE